MIRVRQHIPAFVDGATAKVAEAETQEELLAMPWIAGYAKDTEPVEREGTVTGWVDGVKTTVRVIHAAPEEQRFHQFSLSRPFGTTGAALLMVEHNGGAHHWVVGTVVEGLDQLRLPEWVEHPEARRRREAWNRGEDKGQRAVYRCAEHGVLFADCCLRPGTSDKPRRKRR
jgi:hypothetical protein